MINNKDTIQLVTLESFYDVWEDPLARDLFVKTIQLKLKGYLHEYSYGILPVDTTDFFATHHIVCHKKFNELVPIMAYKSIPYSKCITHRVPFPALSLVSQEGLENHKKVVTELLNEGSKKGRDATYDCSWTIDPEIRKDRNLTKELRNIFLTTHILHQDELGPNTSIVCGVLRFKTEQFFKEWGYELLKLNNKDLSKFFHPSLDKEEVVIMQASIFLDSVRKIAEDYREIWENRILISNRESNSKKIIPFKKAA